ncbi:hypothetical protein TNCV_4675481 [Trichonephila clavipes]|nr:hypothetical protein TNCV_4675481 [Trichonephila clavipes]
MGHLTRYGAKTFLVKNITADSTDSETHYTRQQYAPFRDVFRQGPTGPEPKASAAKVALSRSRICLNKIIIRKTLKRTLVVSKNIKLLPKEAVPEDGQFFARYGDWIEKSRLVYSRNLSGHPSRREHGFVKKIGIDPKRAVDPFMDVGLEGHEGGNSTGPCFQTSHVFDPMIVVLYEYGSDAVIG